MTDIAGAIAPFTLPGKVALVTGAAQGLGREIASLFLDVGASVVITDVDGAAAKATADDLAARGPALGLAMDVTDEDAVRAGFAAAAERFGGIDVLVNNAAYRKKANTMDMPLSEWDMMQAVTTRGTFVCLREAVRQMRRRGGGSIVNISSTCSHHPMILPNMHYDAAKAGVDAITRLACVEFAPDRIRVNSVLPAGMNTPGPKDMKAAEADGGAKIAGPALLPGRNLMGRTAEPIEVARAVLFLASDAASYITGVELLVDGGFTRG